MFACIPTTSVAAIRFIRTHIWRFFFYHVLVYIPTLCLLQVDGETRQDGNTRDMMYKLPFLISYISHIMTLEPGDVILTGMISIAFAFSSLFYRF